MVRRRRSWRFRSCRLLLLSRLGKFRAVLRINKERGILGAQDHVLVMNNRRQAGFSTVLRLHFDRKAMQILRLPDLQRPGLRKTSRVGNFLDLAYMAVHGLFSGGYPLHLVPISSEHERKGAE